MMPSIDSERLVLRPLRGDDLDALATLHAECSFWQYPLGRGQTLEEMSEFLQSAFDGPDDVSDLFDEEWIGGQLEALGPMRPKARQIRVMVVWLIPTSAAIERVDQWVASFGFFSRVLTITASTWSSVIFLGAPGRGSSERPSRRYSTKRFRHLPTMASLTPSLVATSRLVAPSLAQDMTMRARIAIAWALLCRLA